MPRTAQPPADPSSSARGARRDARPPAHGRRRSRRRKVLFGVAGVATGLLVAGVAFAGIMAARVAGNIAGNSVARPGDTDGPEIPDWNGAVNLLIMGSDVRAGQTSANYGDEGGARSDVMMLLHVSSDHSNATLVSIPRDTMLPTPECTTPDGEVIDARESVQINGVLNDGPYCSLDTIREFTGLDVDHFIIVDFDGVIGVTDAIGGVEICLAEDVDDPDSGLTLAAGEHTIQGAQALAFLRTRHGIGDGSDLGRIATQQTYLSALARKVKDAGTLTNPVALFGLADAASRSITVDDGLAGPDALVGLAGTLANIDLANIALVQLPVRDYWADPNRVEPIAEEAEALFAALGADEALVFATDDPEADASDGGEDVGDAADAPAADAPAADAPAADAPAPTQGATPTPKPKATLAPGTKGQDAATVSCAGAS
ncbi:LCP family protein [Agromyces mediolanus]|uniref:LCP family protein n=1 Tax=Agromyces mediolanus TaxID=41986 RepID=UPI0038374370